MWRTCQLYTECTDWPGIRNPGSLVVTWHGTAVPQPQSLCHYTAHDVNIIVVLVFIWPDPVWQICCLPGESMCSINNICRNYFHACITNTPPPSPTGCNTRRPGWDSYCTVAYLTHSRANRWLQSWSEWVSAKYTPHPLLSHHPGPAAPPAHRHSPGRTDALR